MIPSMFYRMKARAALRPVLSTALLVLLLAQLPSLIAQAVFGMSTQTIIAKLEGLLLSLKASSAPVDPAETLMQLFSSIFALPGVQVSAGLAVLAALVCPVLNLGCNVYLLKRVRGQEASLQDLLSRKELFLRALWQQILIAVRLFLWGLLGMLLMMPPVIIAVLAPSEGAQNIVVMSSNVATIVSLVLIIRAELHYSMAAFVLADHPEMRSGESIRASVAIMRNRKSQLLMLYLSFIGWVILSQIVTEVFFAMLPVLGLMVNKATALALNLYMITASVVFYDKMTEQKA